MYSYFPETIWVFNRSLITATVLLCILDILYVALREASEARKIRKMAIIKKNLQSLAGSGKKAVENICPKIIGRITNEQFLGIARDKESILSREFAQELKNCFIASGKISQIAKIARRSRNKWRRIQAIISLGYANPPEAPEILKNTLMDKDEDVAYYSLLALGQIKTNESARILFDSIKNKNFSGNRILSLLEGFPSSVIDEAARATQSTDSVERYWAVKLLSRFKPKGQLKSVEELTKDDSVDVRAAACECLGKIGAPEARAAVARCLGDKFWFVRMNAVRTLSGILGRDCIGDVAGLLKDDEELVRDSVKIAMELNIEASLPYIERFIREDNKELQKDCAEILEESGYMAILFKHLLSSDAALKTRSERMLEGIISSGAHLGLESTLAGLDKESRKNALQVIAHFNKGLAEHIDQKLKNKLVEA